MVQAKARPSKSHEGRKSLIIIRVYQNEKNTKEINFSFSGVQESELRRVLKILEIAEVRVMGQ